MIHYSCDRCQRLIETEDEVRYTVRVEIEARLGENVFAEEDDHLLEVNEILEREYEAGDSSADDEVYTKKRFDLCYDCYRAFISNPMGKETSKSVDFSQN